MLAAGDNTIIYVDLDDTLCDFHGAYISAKAKNPEIEYPQSQPGFYLSLKPLPEAVEVFHWLQGLHLVGVCILTAPSIKNPHSYTEKRLWVEKHLGWEAVENLIISPYKNLNIGDFLIDNLDQGNGQDDFSGKLLHFGSDKFPDWKAIQSFFEENIIQSSCLPQID